MEPHYRPSKRNAVVVGMKGHCVNSCIAIIEIVMPNTNGTECKTYLLIQLPYQPLRFHRHD